MHELGGYSAHADQRELVEWARASGAKRIKLVHGEDGARKALGARLAGEEEGD